MFKPNQQPGKIVELLWGKVISLKCVFPQYKPQNNRYFPFNGNKPANGELLT